MFADSTLFLLASELRTLLADNIDGLDVADVLIGTPKQAADLTSGRGQGNSSHALNLFFYRFEPGAYPSAAIPDEPLYLRAHCLITTFAINQVSTGSAGQNDLRLLGESMRVLHQHPQLRLAVAGQTQASVQIIPAALSTQDLNQVWSMLGSETSYRPSAAYELALVPIPLGTPVDKRPKVAAFTAEASPDTQLDASAQPQLLLLTDDGPAYALSTTLAERPATLRLQVRGQGGASLRLRWQLLLRDGQGWTDGPSETLTLDDAGSNDDVTDPQPGRAYALPLAALGQAMVWVEPVDAPSLGSKPVLVILHEGEP